MEFNVLPTAHYDLKTNTANKRRRVVTWCFTPSQPLRLYQGEEEEKEEERKKERKERKKKEKEKRKEN